MESEESQRSAGNEETGPDTRSDANLPRKEREKARHRRDVLRAAENLLSKKSYAEISVQEIAEAAEFSVGYLYKLFLSKEDIFESLIRSKHEEIAGLIDGFLSEPVGVEERLSNFVHGTFEWLNRNPAYTSSSARELMLISCTLPGLAAEFSLRDAQHDARLKNLFSEGIREGIFGGEDPGIMAKILKVLMKGFIQEDLVHERRKVDWTEYAPVILRIFMRAFAPEGRQR
jgi:TetR/AcrR family transcriptional regulator